MKNKKPGIHPFFPVITLGASACLVIVMITGFLTDELSAGTIALEIILGVIATSMFLTAFFAIRYHDTPEPGEEGQTSPVIPLHWQLIIGTVVVGCLAGFVFKRPEYFIGTEWITDTSDFYISRHSNLPVRYPHFDLKNAFIVGLATFVAIRIYHAFKTKL